MLHNHLVTKQSGEEGPPVSFLYLVQKLNIDKEIYLVSLLTEPLDAQFSSTQLLEV